MFLQLLQEADIPKIVETFNFPWTTLEATEEKWKRYYKEQTKNARTVCLAKLEDNFVGYGSLVLNSLYPNFKKEGISEIHNVWVSSVYRGSGFGRKIIQQLEEIARTNNCKQIGIGVGLYKDYGAAQKLYVQMGYVPDGLGVTYNYKPVSPGQSCPIDDDLVIWLKKDLS